MGKSSAVQMLCAYYDKTCDSASLFDDLDVVEGPPCCEPWCRE